MAEIVQIPIEKIHFGNYTLRMEDEDEEIEGLAASIRRIGVVVPLHVCRKDDQYYLVAGHRRYVAARRVGLEAVPCIEVDSKQEKSSEVAFAENFFRRDLSPVELSCALNDCITKQIQTAEQLAQGFHRSVHWVHQMVAIQAWPADVLEAIHNGKISVSAASNLAIILDDDYRAFLLRNAVEQGATARTTAAWLQAWRAALPKEQAVEQPPAEGREPVTPALPQAPCLVCNNMFRTDGLAMVLVCPRCIGAIRGAALSG